MPKLTGIFGSTTLYINLLANEYLVIDSEKDDYENWIPFSFKIHAQNENAIEFPEEIGPTFSLEELKYLISSLKEIVNQKSQGKIIKPYEFGTLERYFTLNIYDTHETDELYIDVWIIVSKYTHGAVYGYDKG